MPIVDLPDGREVEFPEGTSRDVMNNAVRSLLAKTSSSEPIPSDTDRQPPIPISRGESALTTLTNIPIVGMRAKAALSAGIAKIAGGEATEDMSYPDLYKQGLEMQREKLQQAREQFPLQSFATQLLGDLAPASKILKATNLAGKGFKAAAAGSALLSGGQALGETKDLTNLPQVTKDVAEASGEGALLGGALHTTFQAGKAAIPVLKKIGAKTSPIRDLREDLSKEEAIKTLRVGLKKEGKDAATVLEEMNNKGVDLIDVIDPRFRLYTEGTKSLNRRGAIQIADESLGKVSRNVDSLQTEVLDLISKNKISPEQAGEILGRNSKKIFDNALEARRIKAAPLYESGLSKGTKIPMNTDLGDNLTLGGLLESPILKDIIGEVRDKSKQFTNTPAERIYGKIGDEKAIPNNDIRVIHAVETLLTDKIKQTQLTGATKEQAALSAIKNKISQLADNANPDLTKARKLWKEDTQSIKAEGKGLVGKFAKFYKEGRSDELTKAAMNILDAPINRIRQAKMQNPTEFKDLLRASIENRIAKVAPTDDGIIKPNSFRNALFGKDQGKSLREALGDEKLFQGMQKLAQGLDVQFMRNRISKNAMEKIVREGRIPTGKFTAVNRLIEGAQDVIVNNPRVQKQFVEFLFTDAGKDALKQIASAPEKSQSQLVNNFISNFVATRSAMINQDNSNFEEQ